MNSCVSNTYQPPSLSSVTQNSSTKLDICTAGKTNMVVLETSSAGGAEGKPGERRLKTGASAQRRNWKAGLSPTVNLSPSQTDSCPEQQTDPVSSGSQDLDYCSLSRDCPSPEELET